MGADAVPACCPATSTARHARTILLMGEPLAPKPTLAAQPQLQVAAHVRPLSSQDAVDHSVADGAVAPGGVVPDHAVLFGAESLDCALRAKVEVVGGQADGLRAERVEGMPEQQQFARRVDVGALAAFRVEGVANLDAVERADDVVI